MVRIILTGHADAEALVDAINRGQVYRYVTKPWDDEDLRLTVVRALQHYEVTRSRHEAEETNKRLTRRLRAMTRGVVRAIADTLEAKDRYVYGHARRVSGYASAIGRRMRLGTGRARTALAGRPTPRRRQDQHARLRPAQAGRAHRGRARHRPAPLGARRAPAGRCA